MTEKLQTARLTDFFKNEYNRMVRFVRMKVDSVAIQDAEDIVQEVAVNLFQKADISAPIENISAYVYRALRNEIIDFFRKKKPIVSLDQPVKGHEQLKLVDIIKSTKSLASSELEKREIVRELYTLLDNLSEDERALIIATEIEGHGFKELAERWQVPINTLLSRKSRAMRKLFRETRLIQ